MTDKPLKKNISKNNNINSQNFNEETEEYEYEYEEADLNNNNNLTTDENITFIQEEDILKEREKMIEEAIEKLFLERDQAILAMIYYEWNLDNLDNWYEDVDINKAKAGIDLSQETKELLQKEGVVSNGDTCLTCFEEKNDTFFYFLVTIGTLLGVPEAVYKKFIKDKSQLEKLDKAIFKNFINRNEDFKQCPNPKCHIYSKSSMHSAREIQCKCGTTYCFKCSKDTHRPCS